LKTYLRKILVLAFISFFMFGTFGCLNIFTKATTVTPTETSQTTESGTTETTSEKTTTILIIPTRTTTSTATSPTTTTTPLITTTVTTTTTTLTTTPTTGTTSTSNGFEITMPYYESAEGLSGSALLLELREIVNQGFLNKTYGDSRYILDETDADPNHSGNVILMYTGVSVSGAWDNGVTWNRDHIWPQSLLGVDAVNTVANAASDLQNLKPANPLINSTRGNKYFGTTTTTESYALRQEDRGDIARILLYMVVMYSEYTLLESNPSVYQMAQLSLLLQWHVQDPVDAFEQNRNNVIYSYQKNRNPFIDYPQFVDLIW